MRVLRYNCFIVILTRSSSYQELLNCGLPRLLTDGRAASKQGVRSPSDGLLQTPIDLRINGAARSVRLRDNVPYHLFGYYPWD